MTVEEQANLLKEEVSANARYFSMEASRLAGRDRLWTAIQTGAIAASIAPLLLGWGAISNTGWGVIASTTLLLGALLTSIWSLARNHAEQFAAAIWASDRCDQIEVDVRKLLIDIRSGASEEETVRQWEALTRTLYHSTNAPLRAGLRWSKRLIQEAENQSAEALAAERSGE